MNKKRIVIAAAAGLVAGFCCVAGGTIMFGMTFTPLALVFVISNRMLIGFAIGISSLKMSWLWHGLLIGFIVGFPFPIYDLITGQGYAIAGAAFAMSMVFGVAIEFFTTVVCKAQAVNR